MERAPRRELCGVLFLTAMERQNLALRNEPILILVAVPARSRPPLQVKFVGAPANLLFKINCEIARNGGGLFPILGNFGGALHRASRNGTLCFLSATGGRVSSCLASHAVLLTGTQLEEWSYVMKKRHMRTPIAAIRLFAANSICKYNANGCGRASESNENSSFSYQKSHSLGHAQFAVVGDQSTYSVTGCRWG